MTKQSTLQEELSRFTRIIALMFNRATMYHINHPYVTQTLDEFSIAVEQALRDTSPLVFILSRDQFFIDELPFDSRTNVNRILAHFKKASIQSISFESGLTKNEIKTFFEVFTSLEEYPEAEAMKRALITKGVRHMKINHVFFRKVTEDDEVLSHDALKKLTPQVSDEEQRKSKKYFIDMVLERLLSEELRQTVTIENLLRNPAALSKKMTETDLSNSVGPDRGGSGAGLVLLHQLEMLGDEVANSVLGDENANLPEVASALFEMKKRLLEGMEAQKSLNISYANEEMILDKVNDITDTVVLKVIKDEYKAGKTSTQRLAQILRRLVPEPAELKRLLPKIRAALMDEGMPLSEYLRLVQELGKELKSEELASILQESSEEIGIDGETLIDEIKKNPVQAAELIFLASEIRKGSGDERALSDLLVEYVERLGSNLALDITQENQAEGEQHFRHVVSSVESSIVGRLKNMDVKDDLLERLEERFNNRIDEILERVKLDWIHAHADLPETAPKKELTVLELLEKSAVEGDDLGEILAIVRAKVQAKEMDENDFGMIYAEITKQHESRSREKTNRMPKGVLPAPTLTLLVEKELARAKRYDIPFSALAISLVKAVQKTAAPSEKISYYRLVAAVLEMVVKVARDSDIIGEMGRNRIMVLLPMTPGNMAQLALRRYLKALHGNPVNVDGTLLNIRFAGVASSFNSAKAPDAGTFLQVLMADLVQMERRIKNLQAYF